MPETPPPHSLVNSAFFLECAAQGLDTAALVSLCDFVQAPPRFPHFDLASKRLAAILPLAAGFHPRLAAVDGFMAWSSCIHSLLPHTQASWFTHAVDYTVPAKQDSVNRLGSLKKGHDYYAALIVDTADPAMESQLVTALAILFAVKALSVFEHPDSGNVSPLPSANQLTVVASGLCQATRRWSLWEQMTAELLPGDCKSPQTYLETLSQRCRRINERSSTVEYKDDQRVFSRALLAFVNTLLAQGDWENIQAMVASNPKPSPTSSIKPPFAGHPAAEDDRDESVSTKSGRAGVAGNLSYATHRRFRSQPAPSDDFSDVALAPEDSDNWLEASASRFVVADDEPLSESAEQLYARYNRFLSELDNQYLPIRWNALNRHELNTIMAYLKTAVLNPLPHTDKVTALLISLTLATGHPLDALWEFRLESAGKFSNGQDCRNRILKTASGYVWQHVIPMVANRYQPSASQQALLNPVGDIVVLPLPDSVGCLLDQCLASLPNATLPEKPDAPANGVLLALLGGNAEAMKRAVLEQLAQFRTNRQNRCTLARLGNVMFDQLMQVGADEVAAYTVLGMDCDRPVSGLYYTTFGVAHLQTLYGKATHRLFASADPEKQPIADNPQLAINHHTDTQPDAVGSKLDVSISLMQQTVAKLHTNCQALFTGRRDIDKIIAAHNAYTHYVVMCLLFSTGHRAVNDPFHDPACFFPERHAVIITDKVELQEHEGRLVWFGATAKAQLQAYWQHLHGLSLVLAKYKPDLASAIQSLLRPTATKYLPLFFHLSIKGWESLKPATLAKGLGDTWPLPLNANRHFLSTQLRKLAVPAEYISYQLGHVQIGQLPFGQYSVLSPQQVGAVLVPALTELETLCGWQVLDGFRPYGTRDLPDVPGKRWQKHAFGPALREQKRQNQHQQDAHIVRAALHTVQQALAWEPSATIPDAFINSVLVEIQQQSQNQPQAYLRRHNLFRRFIQYGRHRKHWHTAIPSLLVEVKGEQAALRYADGLDITVLESLQRVLISSICEQFKLGIYPPTANSDPKTIHDYFAYCRLSALLFGQLCEMAYWGHLEIAIAGAMQSYQRKVWLNFYAAKATGATLQYRWFPDELTTVLMIRCRQNLSPEQIKAINPREVTQAVSLLLKGLLLQANVESAFAKQCNLSWLIATVKTTHALNFPGVVRAFINGDVTSWSLPPSAWQRLLTGKPLASNEPPESTSPETPETPEYRFLKSTPSATFSTDKLALKALRLCFQHAQSASSGHNPHQDDNRSEAQRRHDLGRQLKHWHQAWHKACSGTLLYQHAWLEQLLNYGTAHKKQLKLSTLYEYLKANATPLIEQAWALNLAELEDDGLFQLYEKILAYGKDSARPYRATRLEEFHQFLIRTYALPAVDFDELHPQGSPYGVDANIITPAEYQIALGLLLEDPAQSTAGQTLQALLLCLMYRNGLRPGEAVRLLVSDVVLEDAALVYIRNNRYGLCKSVNGVRQIPFFARLDDAELALLQRWAAHRQQAAGTDHLSPFFSHSLYDNSLVVRQAVMRRLTQALRLATGDQSVKIHHLRHSFATYYVLAAMGNESPIVDWQTGQWLGDRDNQPLPLTETLFGKPEPSRRILYQLANLIGHGNPGTTFHHYCHCLDVWVAHCRPAIPDVLPAADIITLLGYSQNSLRPILARLKLSAPTLQLRELLPHYLKQNCQAIELTFVTGQVDNNRGLPPLPDQPPALPSLDTLAKLLAEYSHGLTITTLAKRYFYPPEQLTAWLSQAARLQQQTGYKRFRLPTPTPQTWALLASLEPISDTDKATEEQSQAPTDPAAIGLLRNNKDNHFIGNLQQRLADPHDATLKQLLPLWQTAYQPKNTGFYCHSQAEAEQLIQLLADCGIAKSRLYLEIPDNFRETFLQTQDRWQTWLENQYIPTSNIRFIASNIMPRNLARHTKPLAIPGITIAAVQDAPTTKTPNIPAATTPYFTTEFISYYLFLAGVLKASENILPVNHAD